MLVAPGRKPVPSHSSTHWVDDARWRAARHRTCSVVAFWKQTLTGMGGRGDPKPVRPRPKGALMHHLLDVSGRGRGVGVVLQRHVASRPRQGRTAHWPESSLHWRRQSAAFRPRRMARQASQTVQVAWANLELGQHPLSQLEGVVVTRVLLSPAGVGSLWWSAEERCLVKLTLSRPRR